jgi:hypothetical protein
METESPGPNPGFGSKKGYLERKKKFLQKN